MKKIILIFCCFIFAFAMTEAKTYTNNEYQFALWVPDGMEIFTTKSDGTELVVKGEINGLNITIMAGKYPNSDGESFSSLKFVKGYLDVNRQLMALLGNANAIYYYNNPYQGHYYPVVIRKFNDKDYVSGEANITIHNCSIMIMADGQYIHSGVIKQIFDSFTCLYE